VLNSGYSNSGASLSDPSLIGWPWQGGAAIDDIDANVDIIRQRARDLYYNAPVITTAINQLVNLIVGSGIKPIFTPDADVLGWTPEYTAEWKAIVKEEFEVAFVKDKECDAERRRNLYEQQELALLLLLVEGDIFAALPMIERDGVEYDTRIQLVEADVVSDPQDNTAAMYALPGTTVYKGIEVSQYGNELAYYIATQNPLQRLQPLVQNSTELNQRRWIRIPLYGSNSGRYNMLHMARYVRPGQRRGISLLAPLIKTSKQFDRYTDAELQTALLQTMQSLFVVTEMPDAFIGEMKGVISDARVRDSEIAWAPGSISAMLPGESIQTVTPTHPNSPYMSYVEERKMTMFAAMGVGLELGTFNFRNSYSSSRASLNMTEKVCDKYRSTLNNSLNTPLAHSWMDEAVARGRIPTPTSGYFEDPRIRRAYQHISWQGPAFPALDQLKDAQASAFMISIGASTFERETARLTGTDFFENVAQIGRELQAMCDAGMEMLLKSPSQRSNESFDGSEQENAGNQVETEITKQQP